ncbi:hypothetical protein [Glaciecola sp. SC05]|uniref:lectin-like domain-containing protein n=1 Tax=Glaciecola sp. SC05 TaxID=1987355 RepID=UPI0035282C53
MKARYIIKNALASLLVIASASATSGVISNDFSDATGVTTVGSAAIVGGVGRLTTASGFQNGSIIFDATDGGIPITGFSGSFDFSLTNANGGGADGISFGLFDSAVGLSYVGNIEEEGSTTGFALGFDTWNNGAFDTSANEISLRNNGVLIQRLSITDSMFQFDQGSSYTVDLSFVGGLLDLSVTTGSTTLNVFNQLAVTGWQALDGQFYFGGRTGGANNLQVIDNVFLETQTVSTPSIAILMMFGAMAVFARRFK